MIVLDANILIRAVLGRRARELIDAYASQGVRFFAPEIAFADAEKYLPAILKKRGKPHELSGSLGYLREIIEPVPSEIYAAFESEARLRLRGRDEDDWPVLASALALSCDVWTEDADFFGTGIAVWTTNRVEIFLKEQAKWVESQEDLLHPLISACVSCLVPATASPLLAPAPHFTSLTV